MRRLVLYGGAFNPVHNGHLRLAKEAADLLGADVIFLPTKKPRWKETLTADEDRVNMLRLALKEENDPRFSLSFLEMERKGDAETYTSDTIKEFKQRYPDHELILLIGGDQVALFDKWHEPDYIKDNAKIYFVERGGYEDPKNNEERYQMTRLSLLNAGEVSSSAVRELSYIDVPLTVLDYINEHSLYYVDKLQAYLSEKRLKHSLSVARLSYEIAMKNKLTNPGRAYIAGALHDIGKEIPDEEAKKMVSGLEKYPRWAWHQFVGAYLAEKEFFIKDQEILEAIRAHCTGTPKMNDLAMIVYAADKIDPLRGWPSQKYIELCKKDYKEGFLAVLKANEEFLSKKSNGSPESVSVSKECFQYYLGGKK